MPPPLSLVNLTSPPTALEWNTQWLSNLTTLLSTAWQPGQTEREMIAGGSLLMQEADVAASICIQAGFLNFAANGFVTFTDQSGVTQTQFVTPDPSIPSQNPTGALGWLDVLADGVYDIQRNLLTKAGGVEAILNTSGNTYGPFSSGTFHVAQPSGPSYSSTAAIATIPPSTALGTVTATASLSGLIKLTATGVWTVGQVVFVDGVSGTAEANGAWTVAGTDGTTYISLAGSTWTNAWSGGGTIYQPTTVACSADVGGSASTANPNTITTAITSLIGVKVANYTKWIATDTEGNQSLAQRCKLALAQAATGMPINQIVFYALESQALAPGLTPAQAVSQAVTRVYPKLDVTTGIVNVTLASASGPSNSTDVAATALVLYAFTGITSYAIVAQAAASHPIAVVITVYVPAAYNTTANQTYFATAVTNYFGTIPIAGVNDVTGNAPTTNMVPYEGVIGSVFSAAKLAGIPVQDVQGTLAGGTSNVQLALTPVPEVATISGGTPTLTLVSV
jgi:hypothetical protein